MRRYHKNRIKALMLTLQQAHSEITQMVKKKKTDATAKLLEECQQAAISVGNLIEDSEGEGTEAVHKLEIYCELIFDLHTAIIEGIRIREREANKKLNQAVHDVIRCIEAFPTQLEVVFLPYKASMWDSLESVWMAADADESCEAYVIPIPYYDKHPDESFGECHYEIDDYPENVPVVKYETFDFEEHHPDMIFIHNPYDDYNYVTSVHPDFYSARLKQYTDCLVYIPYYAVAGKMAEAMRFLPSYMNMDYIVVQSESMIKEFDSRIPRKKFLPLGSPKFDRVIRMCKNPPEPPAEWKKKITGKRVYFYNTSINIMLADTKQFLKKMKYIFDTFRKVPDACILWRPHPLLESTLASLRPELKLEYDRLKEEFIEDDIGIYDDTPDIEKSISWSDAYIGDAGTSVISLFEVAEKPIFILDQQISEAPKKDWWRVWCFQQLRADRQNQYCIVKGRDLFVSEMESDRYHYRFMRSLTDEKEDGQYLRAISLYNKIVILPKNKEEIMVIRNDGSENRLFLRHSTEGIPRFMSFWIYKKYVFLCPHYYPDIVRIDVESEMIEYIDGVRDYISAEDEDGRYWCARNIWKGKIILLKTTGNELKIIDCESLKTERKEAPFNRVIQSFCGIEKDARYFWAIPRRGTVLTRWEVATDNFKDYDVAVEGLASLSRPGLVASQNNYFSNIMGTDKQIIISPNWGNKFISVDVETGDIKEWISGFSTSLPHANSSELINMGVGHFFRDEKSREIYYYYAPLRKTYHISIPEGTYQEVIITFEQDDISRYSDGFKITENSIYMCQEDSFNTMSQIATGTIQGKKHNNSVQKEINRKFYILCNEVCGEMIFRELKRF